MSGSDPKVCVVLAAGRGVRMQSRLPKVLHCVAGKPLIRHVVDAAKGAGIGRILLVVGEDGDAIAQAAGGACEVVVQKERLGTGHAMQQVLTTLKDFHGDVVVLCGDAPLIRYETIAALLAHHRAQRNACTVLTATVTDPEDYGRIVRNKAGKVLRIVEEKKATEKEKEIREINSGGYCLRFGDAARALEKIRRRPRNGEYPLTDVVEILAASGKRVGAFAARDPEEVMGINARQGLAAAHKVLQRRIADFHMGSGVTIVDPDNTYIGADVRIGRDTIIEPFTVIEGRVRIGQGCVVGPFAHLRDGTVLEDKSEIGNFVEVKKSTIGAGSKAKHLSYLGDATLGSKVNIGAGTITANYDGTLKHPTRIEDGAHIGSNTTLVAPVTVGAGAVTGAGSVVLREQNVPPRSVVVGVPARVIKGNGRRK